VVLVHAEGVETDPVSQFQLVEVLVVVLRDLVRVAELVVRRGHIDAVEPLREVSGEVPVRHQMEEDELQRVTSGCDDVRLYESIMSVISQTCVEAKAAAGVSRGSGRRRPG